MNVYKKILITLCVLFAGVGVTMWVSFLLGFDTFSIKSELILNPGLLDAIFRCSMFIVNLGFMFAIVYSKFNKTIAIKTILYIPLHLIFSYFLGATLITSTLLPLIYVVLLSFKDVGFLRAVKDCVIITISFFIAQFMIIIGKFNQIPTNYVNIDAYKIAIYSIDLFLGYFIAYLMKGGVINALVRTNPWKHVFLVETFATSAPLDAEDTQALNDYQKLSNFQKSLVLFRFFGIQFLQLILIVFATFIGNVLVEFSTVVISFWVFGTVVKRRWHADSVAKCTIISVLIFYTAAKLCPPLSVSAFAPVIIGLGLSLILWWFAIKQDEYNIYRDFYATRTKKIDLECCTLDELLTLCKRAGLNKENTQLSIDMFYIGLSNDEIASTLCIETESVSKRKMRLKKKLKAQE